MKIALHWLAVFILLSQKSSANYCALRMCFIIWISVNYPAEWGCCVKRRRSDDFSADKIMKQISMKYGGIGEHYMYEGFRLYDC
jgi:hypothetical protein